VPLLKFADGVANEFKLPVFAAQSTGSDPEALIDFTIQTSAPLTFLNILSIIIFAFW